MAARDRAAGDVGPAGEAGPGDEPEARVEDQSTSTRPPVAQEPSGRRLSRQGIVEAAVDLIDTEGVPALTMRRLGAVLGVEAMSLYRYVNGREDLLEGVVEQLVSSIETDPGTTMKPMDGWQAFLQWIAHSTRQLMIDHPNAFPLVATRHPAAPWLRPPLRSLRIVQGFLNGLIARGFSEDRAVEAYRAFTSFLLGHLLLEAAMRGAPVSPAEEPLDEGGADIPHEGDRVDVSDYPTIARLHDKLAEDHTEAEFETALEDLLQRLDLQLSQ